MLVLLLLVLLQVLINPKRKIINTNINTNTVTTVLNRLHPK